MNNFSWAEIDEIGQSGRAQQLFSIGDTKDISVSGETVTVEIFGFNHDDLQNGGKAVYTFGMKHLMANVRQMNEMQTNTGSFGGSDMYDYLKNTILPNLPQELKNCMKTVNKRTSGGNKSTETRIDAIKIFLFSVNEVAGTQSGTWVSNDEGSIYPVFTGDASRIKKLSNGSGDVKRWWLRSPVLYNSGCFCDVSDSGYVGNPSAGYATISEGVCFGFCV